MPQDKVLKQLAGKQPGTADAEVNGDVRPKKRRKSKSTNGAQDKEPVQVVEAVSEDEGDLSTPEASNAVRDMGCAVNAEIDDAGGDGWRKGLEELRKRHKPQARSEQPKTAAGQPQQERLLALVRSAFESGSWTAVTGPALVPRPSDIAAVVRQLDERELLALLQACAKRHESHPRERNVCSMWIVQALEDGGEDVARRKAVRRNLRPLLNALSRRVGPATRGGEVLSSVGKWRYVAELAAVRRETLQATGASASQPSVAKKAPPQGGEESDSDNDADDDDNGEAGACSDNSDE